MADVFISYARENRWEAECLAAAIERLGLTVFWDRTILPGEDFATRIRAELDEAACVVVLWSSDATRSRFVVDEADLGHRRDILVPVFLEAVDPPLGFGRLQASDLSHVRDWTAASRDPQFADLAARLRAMASAADATQTPPSGDGTPGLRDHGVGDDADPQRADDNDPGEEHRATLRRRLQSRAGLLVLGSVLLLAVAGGMVLAVAPGRGRDVSDGASPVHSPPSSSLTSSDDLGAVDWPMIGPAPQSGIDVARDPEGGLTLTWPAGTVGPDTDLDVVRRERMAGLLTDCAFDGDFDATLTMSVPEGFWATGLRLGLVMTEAPGTTVNVYGDPDGSAHLAVDDASHKGLAIVELETSPTELQLRLQRRSDVISGSLLGDERAGPPTSSVTGVTPRPTRLELRGWGATPAETSVVFRSLAVLGHEVDC